MRHLLLLVGLVACGGPAAQAPTPVTTLPPQHRTQAPLVGVVTREQVLAAFPAWQTAFEAAAPDPTASAALSKVPAGAVVDVYFGTWCPDSRHELTRLWKALDQAGAAPFTLRLYGVDRKKQGPEVTAALDLKRVPTFVVLRDGKEVGRIVEHAPAGIETELAELLRK